MSHRVSSAYRTKPLLSASQHVIYMQLLLCAHEISRRLNWDYRKLRTSLRTHQIEPDAVLLSGRALYSEAIVERLERLELEPVELEVAS
jgi:hypothetical protein